MCVLRICLRIFDFYNVSSCTIIQISKPTNWSAEQVSLFQFPKSFKINKLNNLPLQYVNGWKLRFIIQFFNLSCETKGFTPVTNIKFLYFSQL